MAKQRWQVGNRVAPWRFLLFAFVSLVAGGLCLHWLGVRLAILGGFDAGALAFLVACIPLFDDAPAAMREAATRNDANRGGLLLLSTVVTGVILVSVGTELSGQGKPPVSDLILVVVTLALCWMFSNLVYALHYAHLYYTRNSAGKDQGGVTFPGSGDPDYWDFAYFSSCLGMTFQTSDVEITSRIIRRTTMFHCLLAFVFNLGVIAFTINILGSH